MPRMNECFMGFWIVHISPPGHNHTISFLGPDRARGSKTFPLPCVVFSLLQGIATACTALPSGQWVLAPLSHSCSCYQKHLISIECFGRSTAPKLPSPSLTTLDQELWLNTGALLPSLCGLHWADPLPEIPFDTSFLRFLLAAMPRVINRPCFLTFVQSVLVLLFQNISVSQVLQVLLTKCLFSALFTSFL